MNKTCTKCHLLLSPTAFNKHKGHKDGLGTQCRKCRKEYSRKYWEENKERFRQRNKKYWKWYYQENKQKVLEKSREWQVNLKKQILEAYGGAICYCCGETEFLFLSIDHKLGGGNLDRKFKTGNSRLGGYHFYNYLRKHSFPDKEKLQVSCMNCQFGKIHNNGICPHQKSQ